jgi:hypothetical protein
MFFLTWMILIYEFRDSATIFNVRDKIEAMIKKLELFSVCINKDNTQVFPSLYDFFVCKWI